MMQACGVRVVFLEHVELLAFASSQFAPTHGPLSDSFTLFCSIISL